MDDSDTESIERAEGMFRELLYIHALLRRDLRTVRRLAESVRDGLSRASFYEATNRVRSEGGRNLVEAARAAGARRFVTQSIAFLYAPEGGWVKDEEGRPMAVRLHSKRDLALGPLGVGTMTSSGIFTISLGE